MSKTLSMTNSKLSERIQQVPRSFIRDILSVTNSPDVISFAGGLPNKNYFPKETSYTIPEGGMFCWVTMPRGFSSMKLFHEAIKQKVAFVPGVPFYFNRDDTNTFRLNFSCSTPDEIREGVKRLACAMREM